MEESGGSQSAVSKTARTHSTAACLEAVNETVWVPVLAVHLPGGGRQSSMGGRVRQRGRATTCYIRDSDRSGSLRCPYCSPLSYTLQSAVITGGRDLVSDAVYMLRNAHRRKYGSIYCHWSRNTVNGTLSAPSRRVRLIGSIIRKVLKNNVTVLPPLSSTNRYDHIDHRLQNHDYEPRLQPTTANHNYKPQLQTTAAGHNCRECAGKPSA